MKKFLFALLLIATPSFGSDRVLINPESNGDLRIKANVGGTTTDAVVVTGATGGVTLPGPLTLQGTVVSSLAGDFSPTFKTTGTTNALQMLLMSGNGTTSARYAYVTSQSNETTSQRWDAGLFGTRDWVVHDTTGSRTPISVSATDGATTFGTNIKLPTTGGTPSALDFYEEATFSVSSTASGCVSNSTITAHAVRVGKMVSIFFPGISCTSNAATQPNYTGVPARFAPTTTESFPARISDGSVTNFGLFLILTNGTVLIYTNAAANNVFTASGNKGFSDTTITFPIN